MLFRRNVDPCCGYCRYGMSLGNEEIACSKRGIMTTEGKCTSFRYEPTKRKPEHTNVPNIKEIPMEDMSL